MRKNKARPRRVSDAAADLIGGRYTGTPCRIDCPTCGHRAAYWHTLAPTPWCPTRRLAWSCGQCGAGRVLDGV